MPKNTIKLTKNVVDSTAANPTADVWRWDVSLPGFGIRVQPSGRKTYVIRYRTSDHQQRKLTVGRCTDLTPDQARDLARKAFAAVAAGEDPTKKKRDSRSAPTMVDLHERYMRLHALPFKKASSIRLDKYYWRQHIIPELGRKRVDAVTKDDVIELVSSLSASPVKSNHVRALLSKAFNLAIEWKWRTTANPCVGVKRHRIRQRELILTPVQLARMDDALTTLAADGRILPAHANLFRLLSLTGCRLSEIMCARRDWVDSERRLLLLPDSKVGQRRINLSAAAIRIIDAMPPATWLIPGKSASKHMARPHAAWVRIKKAADLPKELRIHDLRHTAGSLGHRAGLTQRQIADMLGHSNLATTERYLHGFVEDRARAVDVVADVITSGWQQ